MHEFEVILGLLVVVVGLAALADRLDVPYPILLVLGGLGLAFVPGLPIVELEPEIVFLLFLPPILFSAADFASWRDFRANLRPISLLAVGLVLTTTVAVAGHAMVAGLSWPVAFVLGAIVSPPDAVATTAMVQRLGVPRLIAALGEGLDAHDRPRRAELAAERRAVLGWRTRGRIDDEALHRVEYDLDLAVVRTED